MALWDAALHRNLDGGYDPAPYGVTAAATYLCSIYLTRNREGCTPSTRKRSCSAVSVCPELRGGSGGSLWGRATFTYGGTVYHDGSASSSQNSSSSRKQPVE